MTEGPIPDQVKEFLAAPNLGALAILDREGAPQATVVWFELEGDGVLINTREGRSKVRNLARDGRCALAVFDSRDPYRSVQVRGRARELRRGEGAGEDIHRLSRRYTGHDYRDPSRRVSYLIEVDGWSTYGL